MLAVQNAIPIEVCERDLIIKLTPCIYIVLYLHLYLHSLSL